jgi:hypothetical protein
MLVSRRVDDMTMLAQHLPLRDQIQQFIGAELIIKSLDYVSKYSITIASLLCLLPLLFPIKRLLTAPL